MPAGTSPRLIEAVLVLGLLAAGLGIFGEAARTVPRHSGEARYIARAQYFRYLFVEHNLASALLPGTHAGDAELSVDTAPR